MKARAKSDLRRRRLAAGISLQAVASRFARGVTRERIRQVESARRVRPETLSAYEHALAAAIRQRDAIEHLAAVLEDSAVEV